MNAAPITFIVILAVMVAFCYIFIRPARQEQRRLEETIRDLRVGDEVVTTSGFFARVKEIQSPEEGPVPRGLEVRALTSAIIRPVATALEPAERPEETKGA